MNNNVTKNTNNNNLPGTTTTVESLRDYLGQTNQVQQQGYKEKQNHLNIIRNSTKTTKKINNIPRKILCTATINFLKTSSL